MEGFVHLFRPRGFRQGTVELQSGHRTLLPHPALPEEIEKQAWTGTHSAIGLLD